MLKLPTLVMTILAALAATPGTAATPEAIQTLVVIYAENRSFDNLYGTFPGANGLAEASPQSITQFDRDGTPMNGLPAIWGGTGRKVLQGAPLAPIGLTEGQTAEFLNGFNHPYDVAALYLTGGPATPTRCAIPTEISGTGSTSTRCKSTVAPTTCSPRGRTPAA